MSIIIGVDIGTSNIKVIAFGSDYEILLSESAPCEMFQDSPDRMEQNAAELLDTVNRLLKKMCIQLPPDQLKGICFSTAMHSIMAVDEQNKPLTNASLWGDTRSTAQANRLEESGLAIQLYRQTGVPVHPSMPVCKLLWLREHEPAIFRKAYKFISIKEYFFYEWFGKYLVDHSIAGASGMQDIHHLTWSKTALEITGIDENRLSRIVPVTHTETMLTEKYSRFFGMDKVPFIIGSSDGCLANIGSGVFHERMAAITIGTSGAIRTTLSAPVLNEEPVLFCYPVLENLYIKGGAINNGGKALQWFAEHFLKGEMVSSDLFSKAIELAGEVSPGSEGLLFLPYLQGERAPVWNGNARGVFFGIHSNHGRSHFARAVLEGIGYAMYDVFCELNQPDDFIDALLASGGFVQSPFWVQLIADIFDKKIVVNNVSDASATGAAVLGRFALGLITKPEFNPSSGQEQTFYPNAETHEIYRKRFLAFRSLYKAVKKEFVS